LKKRCNISRVIVSSSTPFCGQQNHPAWCMM
jgi:hypothetical protein